MWLVRSGLLGKGHQGGENGNDKLICVAETALNRKKYLKKKSMDLTWNKR
jgi:hypothetical protein